MIRNYLPVKISFYLLPLTLFPLLSCNMTDDFENMSAGTTSSEKEKCYVQFKIQYDAGDNIWRINKGNWNVNIDADTEECISSELCFSVNNDCTLVCSSSRYRFIHVSLSNGSDFHTMSIPWFTINYFHSLAESSFTFHTTHMYACEYSTAYWWDFDVTAELLK